MRILNPVQPIKTHDSESQGQEKTACMSVFWPIHNYYSELLTWMTALKFENTVTQTL